MLRRIIAICLACSMLFTLAACTQKGESQLQAADNNTQAQQQDAEINDNQGGGTLVVYYSATGSTEAVAETISKALSADLYEIVPETAYTAEDLDWTESTSRVSREHDDPSLRTVELVSTEVDHWESYDTVFIGYPIWWGIAAWPVDGFVAANDFTGKTVIPFCTSSSSSLGESGKLLSELAENGDWQDGQRFRSHVDEAEIEGWLNGLSLAE